MAERVFRPPIMVTDLAAEKFVQFLHKEDDEKESDGAFFSIGILEGRGCSGNKYYIRPLNCSKCDEKLFDIFYYDFAQKKYLSSKEITEVKKDLIPFAIDKFALFKLIGSTIDFSEEDRFSKGFFFTNPNETGRCGCGQSFSL